MTNKIGYSLAIGMAIFVTEATANIDEIVTVATRAEADLAQVIGSVSVVDDKALKLVSHAHVQQALSRVAGVNLHRGNGQEYLPAVRSPVLTGAGGCGGFLMQEDGIPVRAAGFCNINELFEANTEMAQRIELLRGTGTVLHGSNAMHGVVNIVTPDISDQSSLGLEFGANDYGRVKFKSGTDTLGIAANFTRDGGYRDQSGFDQQKVSLRHRYKSQDLQIDSGLTATNLNQETAGFITGLTAYKDDSLVKKNLNPEAYRDVRSARVWSRISKSEQNYQLVVTPYSRYSQMDFLQHFLPGDPLEENGQKSLGVQVGYYRTLAQGLNVIAGFDAEMTDAFLKQSQDAPTNGPAFLQETIPQGQHYDYQVDASMAAPFMHLDNLGAQLRLSNSHSGFIRLARGFRAPQATELYRLQRAQQITDLDSESIDSLEIGLKGNSNLLSYKLAIYHMEKDHVIFRDSSFFNVSDGETQHRGVELELDYDINEQWSLGLSATQASHTYRNSTVLGGVDIRGNDIDTAPKHFGSARLAFTPSDRQSLELEWQSMGSYYLNPENLHRYEGHNLLHLRAGWSVSESMRLYANINNRSALCRTGRLHYI